MTKKKMTEKEALAAKYALPNGKFDGPSLAEHQAMLGLVKSGKVKIEAPNGENVKFDKGEE